jgi:PAS domain S-box-containing protein
MKWQLEKKIIAGGFGLAMLILGAVNINSYRNTTQLFERQKRVEQTYEVLEDIKDVLTTLRDAERARRGYIITGKEFYLGTYYKAIEEINTKFNLARRSTADNSHHQYKLDLIKPLIDERVGLIQKSVELYKQNPLDKQTQIELTDEGIALHDKIAQVISEIETEEKLLLQRRAAASSLSFRDAVTMQIAGFAISFGLLLAVYWLLLAQIKKRKISEDKFRQMAENIDEVFWMNDGEIKTLLYVNPAYEKIWGRDCTSLYANPKSFLEAVHPEDKLRVMANLEQNATKGYEIEYKIVRPDGAIRWICDRCFPIQNSAGEVYRRIGIAQDITERKRAEAIRHKLEQQKELSELKLRFFSMASHEFRTPLSTILISAQLLENSSPNWTPEKKLKNLHRIQSAAKTMTQLLTDILTLTRAESGKLEFKPESLDLDKFCNDLVEEVELSYSAQQSIFFISHCPGKTGYLDEKLLRSILSNLLSNAVKYSREDSHIYFTLDCESDTVIIFEIQDQGIGISTEDQEKLFESFHRGQNVGDVPGTGLGLAVVKKCVDLHGGRITVNSKVGVGTTFTVSLPFKNCPVLTGVI